MRNYKIEVISFTAGFLVCATFFATFFLLQSEQGVQALGGIDEPIRGSALVGNSAPEKIVQTIQGEVGPANNRAFAKSNPPNTLEVWKSALVETLSEQQLLLLSEKPSTEIVKALSEDDELFDQLLNRVTTLDTSGQRVYLLRLIEESSPLRRRLAAEELLRSPRSIDKQDGVSLLLNIEDQNETTSIVQNILLTEIDSDVLERTLKHLASPDQEAVVSVVKGDLRNLYRDSDSPAIKALALRAITVGQPNEPDILNQITDLVDSTFDGESHEALGIMHQVLNERDISIKPEQKELIMQRVIWVADDNSQPIDSRIEALFILKLLQDNY